jgi:hypothetical protein
VSNRHSNTGPPSVPGEGSLGDQASPASSSPSRLITRLPAVAGHRISNRHSCRLETDDPSRIVVPSDQREPRDLSPLLLSRRRSNRHSCRLETTLNPCVSMSPPFLIVTNTRGLPVSTASRAWGIRRLPVPARDRDISRAWGDPPPPQLAGSDRPNREPLAIRNTPKPRRINLPAISNREFLRGPCAPPLKPGFHASPTGAGRRSEHFGPSSRTYHSETVLRKLGTAPRGGESECE